MSAHCPPQEQLERLLDDRLETIEDAALARHVESCAACQARLEQLLSGSLSSLGPAQSNPEMADALLIRLKKRGRVGDEAVQLAGKQETEDRADSTARVGAILAGKYKLVEEIGAGGMGIIYRATDTVLGREVAVKVLHENYDPESGAALRFAGEAQITSQLQHPSIPPVHALGALPDGRPFLAMKLIRGQTLEASLKARTDVAADRGRFVVVFEQICQALAYAHGHDVIHRDLKPANVMVGAFGEVQVMDWGLAKVLVAEAPASPTETQDQATRVSTQISPTPELSPHTQAGSLVGTPAFAPPEQVAGEIDKVDRRADVFGLGAVLAVILTGKPPYVGDTAESVRVQALRGKLDDCFARLAACGAEPELVALCRRCLAFEPADRPANAEAVAKAVAELRTAADERARRAELERVRVEGKQATAEAKAAERRKRRRLWIGAAAVLALAVVGGLTAVVVVQQRANKELAGEQAKVQARFDMAVKAIETFHTGVSQEALLKNPQLRELRTKLLRQAAGFYTDMETLLAGQTDAKSRTTLATGYIQLAKLTDKIGDKKAAVAVFRKALAVRRELAAAPGADVETRLDVARSLIGLGELLAETGDLVGSLQANEEGRDIAAALKAEAPTDAVREQLAAGYQGIGVALGYMGKTADALESFAKAVPLAQKLLDANPANADFQELLAKCCTNSGFMLTSAGRPAEALEAFRKELPLRQKLAESKPANIEYKTSLASCHLNIGGVLAPPLGKYAESMEATRQALVIYQKLVEDYPAVSNYQMALATIQNNRATGLARLGKLPEALEALRNAVAVYQKLVDDNPAVPQFQFALAVLVRNTGEILKQIGKPAEGLELFRKALAIGQKLVDANPANTRFQDIQAKSHNAIGVVLLSMGKPAEALEPLGKALTIGQKLVDANPAGTAYKIMLANYHNNIGLALGRQQRFAEAFTALDAGLAIRQKLAAADPTNTGSSEMLGYSYAYRGAVRVRAGQPAAAAADLRQAPDRWAKVPNLDTGSQLERSRALALLAGLGGDAKSGVTAAEAKTFADQSVAALAAVKLGWALPSELKEPDFDALRGRAVFQKLAAGAGIQES